MSLKILHIVGDPVGGIRNHVNSLLPILASSGFSVHYAYSTLSKDKRFEQDRTTFAAIGVSELPLDIKKRPSLHDVLNLIVLVRYIRNNGITIVHGHGAKGGLYARLCSILTPARSVYTPHGGVAHNMFGCVGPLYRMVERLLNSYTDYFLFESQYTCKSFERILGRFKGQYLINPNGIDVKKIRRLSNLDVDFCLQGQGCPGINLAVFAMLREQKGQKFAIEAVNELTRQGHACKLHLFGDGPDKLFLQSYVEQHNLQESVFFYGDVANVFPYMRQMDIVLIPSLFESFGYVALEALALNKPVVASRVGGLNETLYDGPGCILVEPSSCMSIVSAVQDTVLGPLPDRAKEHLDNFTTEKMLLKICQVYSRLSQ